MNALAVTHCLLVDDHALFADAVGLLIAHRHPGVTLATANSLAEAHAALQVRPDMALVLLDLTLSDSRGLDTLRDRKSTRLNSSHSQQSRMPSSA